VAAAADTSSAAAAAISCGAAVKYVNGPSFETRISCEFDCQQVIRCPKPASVRVKTPPKSSGIWVNFCLELPDLAAGGELGELAVEPQH